MTSVVSESFLLGSQKKVHDSNGGFFSGKIPPVIERERSRVLYYIRYVLYRDTQPCVFDTNAWDDDGEFGS